MQFISMSLLDGSASDPELVFDCLDQRTVVEVTLSPPSWISESKGGTDCRRHVTTWKGRGPSGAQPSCHSTSTCQALCCVPDMQPSWGHSPATIGTLPHDQLSPGRGGREDEEVTQPSLNSCPTKL